MRKGKFLISLAVSILLVTGFITCKDPTDQSVEKILTGLEVSSPVDTDYTEGQLFNIDNLFVLAMYSNKEPVDVTDRCSFEPSLTTPLTIDDTVVVISYTEDGFTLTANHCITVNPDGGLDVTVSPSTIQVQKGTSYTFSAIVQGGNNPSQGVIWTVEGGGAGTHITQTGFLTVAAGETATMLTVKATSTIEGYTNIFGTAIVTVTNQAVVVTVTDVAVNPPSATVAQGGNLQFSAIVSGTNAPQTVAWTVEGGGYGTNITQTGSLTVAADETATTLTVKAASTVVGYTNIFGDATVTVTSQGQQVQVIITNVTVTPPTAILTKGGNHQFSAVVSGTNAPQTVTWTVEGSNSAGTNINTDGLLNVAAGETSTTLTVKATSTVDTNVFGTAFVSVSSPPAQGDVAIVPATVTVRRGETFQFNATIAGNAANNDVTWSIPDNPWSVFGTTNVSASGLLSVMAGDGSTTFTVTATSKADPTKSASATVTLTF